MSSEKYGLLVEHIKNDLQHKYDINFTCDFSLSETFHDITCIIIQYKSLEQLHDYINNSINICIMFPQMKLYMMFILYAVREQYNKTDDIKHIIHYPELLVTMYIDYIKKCFEISELSRELDDYKKTFIIGLCIGRTSLTRYYTDIILEYAEYNFNYQYDTAVLGILFNLPYDFAISIFYFVFHQLKQTKNTNLCEICYEFEQYMRHLINLEVPTKISKLIASEHTISLQQSINIKDMKMSDYEIVIHPNKSNHIYAIFKATGY